MNATKDRRSGEDRRKDRFGRRAPWIIRIIGNWLVRNPNVFLLFIFLSMLFFFYVLANLAWSITKAIMK
ncbi:MAG: hypothetical protein ACXACY_28210 [Candidatus Hodarchaeales archaeon]